MTEAARPPAMIEFVVKAKQDLHLEGPLRTLHRVTKDNAYPCQMEKNRNFSCLFRHYAKHNGLQKEDLVFSFVDELLPDHTPETVHLMPQDEIWVEHRADKSKIAKEAEHTASCQFAEQFRSALYSPTHSDVTFIVGEEKEEIKAHRVILSARSQYFEAMLREGGSMCESLEGIVRTPHQPAVFRRMLEFVYTNNVRGLDTVAPEDVIALLMLANEYLLDDLRKLCEKAATRIISIDNISRLLLLSAGHNAMELREACSEFVRENKQLLAQDASFRQDVELNPELGLLLFESSLPKLPSDLEDSPTSLLAVVGNKRRRISDQNSENELDRAPAPGATISALMSLSSTNSAAGANTATSSAATATATTVTHTLTSGTTTASTSSTTLM